MLRLLWLVPALPLLSSLVLALAGRRLGRRLVAWLGVGSVALAATLALAIAGSFLVDPPEGGAVRQLLWEWLSVSAFQPSIALLLDPLSLTMMLVVTVIGALIHLYSVEFMADDPASRGSSPR